MYSVIVINPIPISIDKILYIVIEYIQCTYILYFINRYRNRVNNYYGMVLHVFRWDEFFPFFNFLSLILYLTIQ